MPLITGDEGGGGSGGMQTATTTLTDAQIRALPSAPVVLVPAAGAGVALIPVHVLLILKWTANYTNIDPNAALRVRAAGGGDSFLGQLSEPATDANVSVLLANGGDSIAFLPPDGRVNQGVSAHETFAGLEGDNTVQLNNAALRLLAVNAAAGDFTGGDPANVLTVAVAYYTVTLP